MEILAVVRYGSRMSNSFGRSVFYHRIVSAETEIPHLCCTLGEGRKPLLKTLPSWTEPSKIVHLFVCVCEFHGPRPALGPALCKEPGRGPRAALGPLRIWGPIKIRLRPFA